MVNAIKYRSMAAKHHRFAGTCRSPQWREEHLHLEKQLPAFADLALAERQVWRNTWTGRMSRNMQKICSSSDKADGRMARREFAPGNFPIMPPGPDQGYLWEGTAACAKRQRLLSPDQYEIVDVRAPVV